ncbi:diacylglycerol kinase family protein [Pedobacter frigiditerrae]|uniref:Diacylglycerol kinase family protein n=1 Tax=Pedobacter frigiditerrae TaxID=2530452 RepID=A0A4V2MJ80_9SPHI|nr:diacylglycerol kinase family protein [Pedobacter frigiditerrae]TCC93236.1 diacylglycerol kinase family protein [Pedobacter frigiditerrae]
MKKFLKSFIYSFNGLSYAFRTQLSFRVHCLAAVLVVLLGLYFKLNSYEWLWIAIAIAVVVILELVNTAIEILVDLVSPEQNPKAGAIKDVASAAVLIGGLMALVIGLIIFVPKLI